MNFIPAGAESDDEELPDLIAEQFGHHGWNINNVVNLYDVLDLENDLDLVDFGDEDDFFDEDDEWYDDYYDSDFDYNSDYDEEAESQRKLLTGIFKTLEDSTPVLSKLTFHRESSKDAGSRLPRILAGQTETYETLHKLLEEIEFLLKVWKNRVNHPFTAHLERKNQDGGDKDHPESADKNLVLGTDYYESDVESDITDHRLSFKSRTNVNMTLTRKKYCQSTKMYYNIFASEHEFEVLRERIKNMKKHVFETAFNLFLQNVPTADLPNELWEKIWKMTMKNAEPDMPPTHTSGVREKASRQWTLFENERITDCFGAAGNLHMILFEILFKHPYIMSTPKMIEMKTVGNLGNLRYFRYYFYKFMRLLNMKFSRLQLLDNGIPKLVDSSEASNPIPLPKRIEKGEIHMTSTMVMKQSYNPFFVVSPKKPSPLLAVLYENKEDKKVVASIWNASTNQIQCQINTGFSTAELSLQMNSLFQSSDESKFNKFSLTDRGFCAALTSEDGQTIEFYKWNFEGNQERQGLIIDPEWSLAKSKKQDQNSYVLIEKTNENQEWHMLKVDTYGERSELIIIDSLQSQPKILKRLQLTNVGLQFAKLMDYKDDLLFLLCSSDDSIYNAADKKFVLFDIENGKSIDTYHMRDFCELTEQNCCNNETSTDSLHNSCQYEAKFDLIKNSFLISNPYMAGFILYEFDGKSKQTRIVNKGSMFCHTSSKMVLLNGVLFVPHHKEMEMLPMTPDALGSFNMSETFVEILAADLANKQVEPIVSLGPSSLSNSKLLLNEMHRGIHFPYSNYDEFLHPISPESVVLINNYNQVVKLDISKTPGKIAMDEADAMYAEQLKKEEKLRKAEEAKKKIEAKKSKRKEKEERIFKKLKDSRISGALHQWRGSYGFMRPKGEAKALGNVFVHMSNFRIPPECKMRKNVWIECKIVKDAGQSKYKAVDIIPISAPQQSEASNQAGKNGQQSNRRRGNGSGRRGKSRAS